MSGNMHRWKSNDLLEGGDGNQSFAYDTASQFSTYSNISNDDRMRSPDIGQRLRTLFKEGLYTDVKFIISCGGAKSKPSVLAHKAILAIGSSKFREILFESNAPSNEIQINNIPFGAFRNVVEYLYTDDVMFESDENVLETLSAALKFQVQPLVDKCESYIESVELSEDNICSKFQLANDKKLASLKARCVEFIQENTGSVLRSQNFLAANSPTVRSICKMEKLNLHSEIELLQGVIQWAAARQDGKTSQRNLIEPFLKHIRLLNVSCEVFNHFVQKYHNIFTTPEATNILFYLANPSNPSPNLPSWCKRGNNRCTFQHHSAPRVRERGGGAQGPIISSIKKMPILLRPSSSKTVSPQSLFCLLELKCFRGQHQVDGMKLSFDDPVYDTSRIGHLQIMVDVEPSKYHFEELIKIDSSKEVEMTFARRLLARRGDTVYIRAIAKDVVDYKFLQFSDECISNNSPFTCTLASVPKENRFFFISEVIYKNVSVPSRRGPPSTHFRR